MKINTNVNLARVIFTETSYLGIEPVPGQMSNIDDIITFDQADGDEGLHEIIIYNAVESGPITFRISFSGALTSVSALAASAGLFAVTAALI